MTVICGGAASEPIPGFAPTVQISTFALGALAVNWPIPWAIGYAALLGAVNYELTTMCATDPPADPGFTAADGLAMLRGPQLDLVGFANASAKLGQLIKRFAWYQFCRCATVATPAPPAAPAAPAGLPDPSPLLPLAAAPPCEHVVSPEVGPLSDISDTALINTPGLFNLHRLPVGATLLAVTAKNITNGATPGSIEFLQRAYFGITPGTEVATGAVFGADSIWNRIVANGATAIYQIPIISNWVSITFEAARHTPGLVSNHAQLTVDIYCNGAKPGEGQTPCCPPDPILLGQLNNILQTVTLIQRQLAPFAYVSSTVHAGLSGAGSFAISGLLGVKIHATAIPGSYGRAGTSPTEYFGLGFVSFGTPDGYPHSERLERSDQLLLPPRCSAATQFDYDLSPGVVITVTELLREP